MIALMIYIALIGLVAWALTYFIPMPPKFATGIYVLAAIFALLVVLNAFGVLPANMTPRAR